VAPRLLIAPLVLVLAAAGCGGGSNDSSSAPGSTSVSTGDSTEGTTLGRASTVGKPPHFTKAQYARYQTDVKAFRTQNLAALAKVKKCAAPGKTKANLERCVGNSLNRLFVATVQLGRTLANYAGTVSGDCADSLSALIGYAIPYQATVKALRKVVKSGNATASYSAVANLQTVRKGGLKKAAAVDKDCAPPA
jgi:hypothetical protein